MATVALLSNPTSTGNRAFLPRTWRALERDLAHPELAALRAWFDRHIPADRRA